MKIYDLSRPLYNDCPIWPGNEMTRVNKTLCQPADIATVDYVATDTHVATHCDVPLHFCTGGKSIDEVPIETWVGEGVVLDFTYKKDKEHITAEDFEKQAQLVKPGDIVALRTGYGAYYGFNRKYLMDWPAIDYSGAKWLVEHKVKVVGCDTIGIEEYGFKDGIVHKTLLGAETMIVEELNLEEIAKFGSKRWKSIWLPILLKGGAGCFTRAIAIDDEL